MIHGADEAWDLWRWADRCGALRKRPGCGSVRVLGFLSEREGIYKKIRCWFLGETTRRLRHRTEDVIA